LLTGDQVPGKLRWIDFDCLGFEPDLGEPMIIWQQAIAFIQVLEPRPRETQDLVLGGNQATRSNSEEEDPFAF
ncbi:MAG: hypothetical protein SFT94_05615, partial [Pseudanabaenaceae cyanobacterium bins.68]|nr:hypothetical protein [Pseudanabaenaceae cyanobacterium bins.68]